MLSAMRKLAVGLVLLVLMSGCATFVEKRTTQGPTAEEMWKMRAVMQNGREPNFDERGHWQDQMDRRISKFLGEHPEIANSYDVMAFRFSRQVAVGMTAEQVSVLLGGPDSKVTDQAEMEKLARKFWPQIKGKAKEVWLYPGGWRIFIADGRVVDMIQYQAPSFRLG